MFAVHEVTVDARFDAASARLVHLVNAGALCGVCEAAYEGGLAAVRVGPFGGVRGLSKLVRVRFLEPVQRGATMTVALRWEATGATGELFPVLDADLILAGDGTERARLALAGSYRPPFGRAGAVLDRAVMHVLATATIGSLLGCVADAIARPAAVQQPGAGAVPRWWPVAGHGVSAAGSLRVLAVPEPSGPGGAESAARESPAAPGRSCPSA